MILLLSLLIAKETQYKDSPDKNKKIRQAKSLEVQYQYRVTPDQNKKIRQARSLYRNGLINESKKIYNELFANSPYLKEAYIPLKKILRKDEDWGTLEKISELYLKSNHNSIKSKIDILDALIWINNNLWIQLSDEIINNKLIKDRDIKLTLNIL